MSTALEVTDVVKHYPAPGGGVVHALDGVSFALERGQTLGVVGESGCGKSTLARLLVSLEEPTSGEVVLGGERTTGLGARRLRPLRRRIQMVFQDPYASLNPRLTVGAALAEVLAVHGLAARGRPRDDRVAELLGLVGLPARLAGRYPVDLSGGQRQRVGIARALAVEPEVLVLDEAVSALDVSVQAEVMNLLTRLREELGLTYVFISHDLTMVRHISDRVLVLYLGRTAELGPWREVSDEPLHPYSRSLRDAALVPVPGSAGGTAPLGGEVPNAARPPAGCRFHPRCPLAEEVCRVEVPEVLQLAPAHAVACHVAARAVRGSSGATGHP